MRITAKMQCTHVCMYVHVCCITHAPEVIVLIHVYVIDDVSIV